MKHDINSYLLYSASALLNYNIKMVVTMRDTVEPELLTNAVNDAIKRYPYFSVKVVRTDDGGYDLVRNELPIVVKPALQKKSALGSAAVNNHLVSVEYDDKDIYFNINHCLAGGAGIQPWVMTTVYRYVCDK